MKTLTVMMMLSAFALMAQTGTPAATPDSSSKTTTKVKKNRHHKKNATPTQHDAAPAPAKK